MLCRQVCVEVEPGVYLNLQQQAADLEELHVQLILASPSPQQGQVGAVLAGAAPARNSSASSSVATFQQSKRTRTLTKMFPSKQK